MMDEPEIDIVSRVGGAILLAEVQWNPKTATVSKERAMGLAAIEAMREPTEAMMKALRFYGMLDGDPEEAWEKAILAVLDPSAPLRGE